MKLNQFEQHIYNCYLKTLRNGKPWRPRENFDDLNDSDSFHLKRLSQFFSKFPHIKPEEFFIAGNFLHPEERFPPLSFFITRAAIKQYSLYQKYCLDQSPEQQLEDIKNGFKFIAEFCLKNKIFLEDYAKHLTGNIPSWIVHCKNHNINPYCMIELNNLSIPAMEDDEKEIWLSGSLNQIQAIKSRYHNNQKTKTTIKTITNRIQTLIKQKLTCLK